MANSIGSLSGVNVSGLKPNRDTYVDITEVTSGLYDFANFTRYRCRKYMQESCNELESYMKANAPWNDRTGRAREGLKAEVIEEGGGEYQNKIITIRLSHSVDYGVYLELNGERTPAYLSRRRPILEPTIRLKGPDIARGMEGILSKLGGQIW